MPVHHIGLTEEQERRKKYRREDNLGSALGGHKKYESMVPNPCVKQCAGTSVAVVAGL